MGLFSSKQTSAKSSSKSGSSRSAQLTRIAKESKANKSLVDRYDAGKATFEEVLAATDPAERS